MLPAPPGEGVEALSPPRPSRNRQLSTKVVCLGMGVEERGQSDSLIERAFALQPGYGEPRQSLNLAGLKNDRQRNSIDGLCVAPRIEVLVGLLDGGEDSIYERWGSVDGTNDVEALRDIA